MHMHTAPTDTQTHKVTKNIYFKYINHFYLFENKPGYKFGVQWTGAIIIWVNKSWLFKDYHKLHSYQILYKILYDDNNKLFYYKFLNVKSNQLRYLHSLIYILMQIFVEYKNDN